MIKQIYQEWKERRKARIEECRNWMPEPYRITPEELEEINQLLEEMDKMEQRGGGFPCCQLDVCVLCFS